MAVKELLSSDQMVISELGQWQNKREHIVSRLYNTIGSPPVHRNTRTVETLFERELKDYNRRKIRYVVGHDDTITAYLLIPNRGKLPAPALVAMHQTVDCGKDEVAGLDGNQEFLAEVGVQLNQVYKLYEQQNAFAYLMHGNDHSFPQFARVLAYSWLDRFLKT